LTELVSPENYIGPVKDTESPNNPSSDRYVLEFADKQMHFVAALSSNITSSVYAIGGESSQCSFVNMRKRRECGYPGIPPEFCVSNGCCYEVCTILPYALPYPQFYCLLYMHFILICFGACRQNGSAVGPHCFYAEEKTTTIVLLYSVQRPPLQATVLSIILAKVLGKFALIHIRSLSLKLIMGHFYCCLSFRLEQVELCG
jgi:hypothetical protein